jgi:hypothetical protein
MGRPSLARPATLASTALAFLLAGTGLVAAHPGIGTKFDAPLPLPLLFAGAGLTVAATAGYLAVGEREVRTGERALGRLGPGTGRALRTLGAGGFLVLFVTALADGAFGRQVQLENLATVFVWPLWLKGVALVSVLAGSPWRVLSPWRATPSRCASTPRGSARGRPCWVCSRSGSSRTSPSCRVTRS